MRILGIDPGLQRTGWGILEKTSNGTLRFVAADVITTPADQPIAERLLALHFGMNGVIAQYSPHYAAIEETFVNRNAQSSLKLSHARGAIMLTVAQSNLPLTEYAARLVKKTVVGTGRAEKQQVVAMLKLLLPGCQISQMDAADALAVAICHANHV